MSCSYYIYGTNPVPLTYAEEIAHLVRWKKTRNRKSHEVLIKNYLLFTVRKVKVMYRYLPQDAVLTIAHRCLLRSIDGFDPDRAKVGRLCNLIPWYARVANKEYATEGQTVRLPVIKAVGECFVSLDFPKRDPRQDEQEEFSDSYEQGLSDLECSPDGSFESLLDLTHSAVDEQMRKERLNELIECLDVLSQKQRRILKKVYFDGCSFAQIARDQDPPITREAVRQQHTKALHRLRSVATDKGLGSSL